MKGRNIYFLVLGVLLAFVVLMQFHSTRKYSWNPTFGPKDKEPFGCCLFDSLMKQSIPSGYDVTNKTFYQILNDDSLKKCNLLVVGEDLDDDKEMNNLLEMVDSGMIVTLVTRYIGYEWSKILRCRIYGSSFSAQNLLDNDFQDIPLYHISWIQSPLYPQKRIFSAPSSLMSVGFDYWEEDTTDVYEIWEGDEEAEIDLSENNEEEEEEVEEEEGKYKPRTEPAEWTFHACHAVFLDDDNRDSIRLQNPIVASRHYGEGKIIVCTTPLLFTNFGVLYEDNADYVMRVLSLMGDKRPILRVTNFQGAKSVRDYEEAQSPFKFFLKQPPLKWALYTLLITILLFMIFTARRRQRAIPLYEEPINRQVEFAKLIGTLYFHKNDHTDLLQKKYKFFAETVRRLTGIDIDDDDERSENAQQLAVRTGLDKAELERTLKAAKHYADGNDEVTEQTLHMFIEKIDDILSKID